MTFDENGAAFVTVMFTGFHDSAMAVVSADSAVAAVLDRAQGDIVLPAIEQGKGVLVKSAGAGILAYFADALDAVRAAARIQKEMDALNMAKRFTTPLLLRIGMHSGRCAVQDGEVSGDVVDAARRIEDSADAGGILMSEQTWNALAGNPEIYCRFVKQVPLKDAQEPCNAYKAFWNPQEIELEIEGRAAPPRQEYGGPVRSSGLKLVWGVLAMLGIVLLLTLGTKFFGAAHDGGSARSTNDTATPAAARDEPR